MDTATSFDSCLQQTISQQNLPRLKLPDHFDSSFNPNGIMRPLKRHSSLSNKSLTTFIVAMVLHGRTAGLSPVVWKNWYAASRITKHGHSFSVALQSSYLPIRRRQEQTAYPVCSPFQKRYMLSKDYRKILEENPLNSLHPISQEIRLRNYMHRECHVLQLPWTKYAGQY